jgi:hypothetical protein
MMMMMKIIRDKIAVTTDDVLLYVYDKDSYNKFRPKWTIVRLEVISK